MGVKVAVYGIVGGGLWEKGWFMGCLVVVYGSGGDLWELCCFLTLTTTLLLRDGMHFHIYNNWDMTHDTPYVLISI